MDKGRMPANVREWMMFFGSPVTLNLSVTWHFSDILPFGAPVAHAGFTS
jgi:hypothetical protein